MKVKANFGNGSVVYYRAVEPQAETKTTSRVGSVTINNITPRSEGSPAHFEVSFMIRAEAECDGLNWTQHIATSVMTPALHSEETYVHVEDRAAQMLPALFRALADAAQAELDAAAARTAAATGD